MADEKELIDIEALSHYHAKSKIENDSTYVAKEEGKGLSQENFTTTEKQQLAQLVSSGGSGDKVLGSDGKIKMEYMPDLGVYDDVIEGYFNSTDNLFYNEAEFTTTIPGENGKLYVDKSANHSYRYTGTIFTRINPDEYRIATNADIDALFV